jgi:phosphohistidine phosphatase
MELYLIRHADAQPLGENDIHEDADRPLTPTGEAQCSRLAAALLRHGVQLEHLITSPLARARQTAEGLAAELGSSRPELHSCIHLAPGGKRRKLTRFLCSLSAQSVGIVGHRPDLNFYLAWLIGSKQARIDLVKAGVACVHFEGDPDKGEGELSWLITPKWYE